MKVEICIVRAAQTTCRRSAASAKRFRKSTRSVVSPSRQVSVHRNDTRHLTHLHSEERRAGTSRMGGTPIHDCSIETACSLRSFPRAPNVARSPAVPALFTPTPKAAERLPVDPAAGQSGRDSEHHRQSFPAGDPASPIT